MKKTETPRRSGSGPLYERRSLDAGYAMGKKDGYDAGYDEGHERGHMDGVAKGERDLQQALLGDLETLRQDLRLGLRHDLTTPLDVLAAVVALIKDHAMTLDAVDV